MSSVIIIITLGLLLFVTTHSKLDILSRKVINIYLLFWFVVLILSVCNLLHINTVSVSTYLMMVFHLVAFVIGYLLVKIPNSSIKTLDVQSIDFQINKLVDNKSFKVFLVLIVIYTATLFLLYYNKIMLYNNLSDLRAEYYNGADIYGSHFKVINQWILNPFCMFTTPIFAYLCIRKRNWVCLLLGIFLLLYSSLSGGRFGYVKIAIGFIFVVFCLLPELKRNKRTWALTGIAFIGLYLLVTITTVARLDSFSSSTSMIRRGNELMLENTILSLTQPIASYDYAIKNNYVSRVGGHTLGALTLTSVQKIINPFINKVGLGSEIKSSRLAFKQDEYIDIGYSRLQNALYTAVLWYYLDLGWFGVILFPFLIGMLVRKIVSKYYYYNSLSLIILVAILFQKMLFAVFDYHLTFETELLFLLLLLLIGTSQYKGKSAVVKSIAAYVLIGILFTQL